MQINYGVFELHVAEQQLNGAQVGARLKQVCGIAVSKQVRRNALFDAGPLGRGLAGVPNDLRGNGFIRTPAVDRAWK